MKYFLIGLGIFALIVLMFVGSVIGSYNNLVGLRVQAQTKAAQVETQQQRRFDLIPQLVGAVKGSMKQEQAVFKAIADARTKYAGAPSGTPDKIAAANQYESAFARLLVVMENYPQLKSIDRIGDLMVSIEGTENRISQARQDYNEAAQEYNRTRQSFPTMIIAGMFGFNDMPLFQGKAGSENAPQVNL